MKDITLDIKKGERVLLLGENGSGKTTLLRLIAKLNKPTKGEIKSAIKEKGKKWYQKVGVVYQNPDYMLFMPTVQEEVAYNAISPEYAEEILKMFRIEHLRERHPQSLSEGQKRRTGVAAVCASDPKILFLDEPTVGQDYENLKLMVNSIKTLQKESGFAVVTVTHDIRCKDALSDRKITMKQGQLTK